MNNRKPRRAIQITAVNTSALIAFIDAGVANPVQPGEIFKGGSEDLSGHLGYDRDEVARALYRAKRRQKEEATLRGVRFRYVENTDPSKTKKEVV